MGFKVKGRTDEVTTCECCGRTGLKRTVAIEWIDAEGDEDGLGYYGTGCAETLLAREFGYTGLRRALKAIDAAEVKAERERFGTAMWRLRDEYGPVKCARAEWTHLKRAGQDPTIGGTVYGRPDGPGFIAFAHAQISAWMADVEALWPRFADDGIYTAADVRRALAAGENAQAEWRARFPERFAAA